jgi:hypothetical protein
MYPRAKLDHMALTDVKSLLGFLRPKTAVVTHMGGEMLDLGGEYISRRLSSGTTRVIAAADGMILSLNATPSRTEPTAIYTV